MGVYQLQRWIISLQCCLRSVKLLHDADNFIHPDFRRSSQKSLVQPREHGLRQGLGLCQRGDVVGMDVSGFPNCYSNVLLARDTTMARYRDRGKCLVSENWFCVGLAGTCSSSSNHLQLVPRSMSLSRVQVLKATTRLPWTKNFRHLLPVPKHWSERRSRYDPGIKAVPIKDRIKYWNVVPGDKIRVRGEGSKLHEVLSINRFSNRVYLKGNIKVRRLLFVDPNCFRPL